MTTTISRLTAGLTLVLSMAIAMLFAVAVLAPQPAAAASSIGGPISRSEVLQRAQFWVDKGTTYTQADYDPGPGGDKEYRRDCSGLVSLAWHLNTSLVTNEFLAKAQAGDGMHVISRDSMQPGDAMVRDNDGWGSDGHIELFAFWKNANDHSQGAYVYSFNTQGETVRNPYRNSNFGNLGFNSWSEITSYTAIRYNKIVDDAGAPDEQSGTRGDFNGDGHDDIAALYQYDGARTGLWVWYAKPAGGFNTPQMMWDSGAGNWDQTRSKLVAGDYNGDGRTDLGAFYDYGNSQTKLWVWSATSAGGFALPSMVWDSGAGTWDQPRMKPVSGDFNKDGRGDIAAFYDYGNARTGLWIFTAQPNGTFTGASIAWDSGAGAWEHGRTKPVAGDFNADGYTDLGAYYDYGNSRTGLWIFTAKTAGGFHAPSIVWDSGAGAWDHSRTKPVAGDFNADGYTDLGAFYRYENSRTGLWIWTAKTTGGFNPAVMNWDSGAGAWDQARSKFVTGDYNHDGRTDVGALYDYGSSRTGLWIFSAQPNGAITGASIAWDSGTGAWDHSRTKAF